MSVHFEKDPKKWQLWYYRFYYNGDIHALWLGCFCIQWGDGLP